MILKYLHESAPLVFRAHSRLCILFDWLFFSGEYLVDLMCVCVWLSMWEGEWKIVWLLGIYDSMEK